MRIGALLLVGLGFVFAAACTANTSADLVCTSGGGTCLALPVGSDGGPNAQPNGCGEQMTGLDCDPGYVCCLATVGAPAATDAATPATDAAPVTATDSGTKG